MYFVFTLEEVARGIGVTPVEIIAAGEAVESCKLYSGFRGERLANQPILFALCEYFGVSFLDLIEKLLKNERVVFVEDETIPSMRGSLQFSRSKFFADDIRALGLPCRNEDDFQVQVNGEWLQCAITKSRSLDTWERVDPLTTIITRTSKPLFATNYLGIGAVIWTEEAKRLSKGHYVIDYRELGGTDAVIVEGKYFKDYIRLVNRNLD